LIIPVLSGYGPSVSDGVAAQLAVEDVPPPVVVVVVVVELGVVGVEPQPARTAPTPALNTASTSRRVDYFRDMRGKTSSQML
jgi:hypothetical protein